MNGITDAGAAFGIPGFDGDVRYDNPGIPLFTVTGFSGLGGGGTNWYQFDKTTQFSNVLAYTTGSHNIRTGFDARRLETGRRAANNPRGSFTFTGEMTGYSVADFMLGVPRTRDDARRSAPGPRRRLAHGVLHQRQLAGHAKPDVEPRAFATSCTRRSGRSKGSRRC